MEQGQRLYFVFSRTQALRFLSHLDMIRLWERVLRRACLPLRYSQGFHPHPRLSLALPLAVGMTAEAEWVDVEMRTPVLPDQVADRLAAQLPGGILLQQVQEAPWSAPALAARVCGAEYEVRVRFPPPRDLVQKKVDEFLAAELWPVEEQHKGQPRTIDIRGMVVHLFPQGWTAEQGVVSIRLQNFGGKSVRPETVLRALELGSDWLVHRKRVVFMEPQLAAAKGV
jgi:radical SAM-linked protein